VPTVGIGGSGADRFVFPAGAGAPPSHAADLTFDAALPADDHFAALLHELHTASVDNAFGGSGDSIGHHDGLHLIDPHGSDFFTHQACSKRMAD
jgi:hypothetical protein